MTRRTYGYSALLVLVALGVGSWGLGRESAPTEPAPVDLLLEAAEERLAEAEPGFSRFVAAPLSPRPGWDLPAASNERVQFWIEFLTGRNDERTRVWLEREGRYGEFIRSRLRERGMPEDLLYLAMIESGLSSRAYSRAHASGMWQFIAETGRRYGLEVSPYVDARRDPIQATEAALDYLSDLYDRFGSWYLAAAGYNSGENRVERILRERAGGQKGDDALYWRIAPFLPRETRDYVPLMLAAAQIAKDPARHGFHGLRYQEPLAFEAVEVAGGVSLTAVARAAGVSEGAVQDLNTHLVQGVTPPGGGWPVRVPLGTAAAVASNVDRLAREERLATVYHQVRRGETLSHIARRYGVSVDGLRAANGNVQPRRLQAGQRLRIPVRAGTGAVAQTAVPTWTTYGVRRGDTLWGIARRHGVTVRELQQWNRVGSRIYPGQRLRIRV